jgi:cell division protein FtsW (lipid II flippase)
LLALAFLLTSAGLAINGRYLDFPLILVCLPLLMIAISIITVSISSVPVRAATQSALPIVGIWLTTVMVVMAATMAIAVAMTEPGNVIAWWWCAACGLALFLLPARSAQLSQ